MNTDLMFSSKTDQWATPQDFFDSLNSEFHFDLDPCADEYNHKCEKYFTVSDDGLSQNWGGYRVFCNPPYGRELNKWVEKAYREGHKDNTLVCMLIPARTDTKYFHDYIKNRAEVRFIPGRLKFGEAKNAAPFPSMLVIFRGPGM
jgi:site-specific DNA-methyltransferase (adenine-specific)